MFLAVFILAPCSIEKVRVVRFSPFGNKSSSKMHEFNISDINYTLRKQISYHEKMVHLQFDCKPLFSFWQQSIIDKQSNWCRNVTSSGLKKVAAGSDLLVKKITIDCSKMEVSAIHKVLGNSICYRVIGIWREYRKVAEDWITKLLLLQCRM